MIRLLVFCLSLFSIGEFAFAQSNRLEIPSEQSIEAWHVLPVARKYVVLATPDLDAPNQWHFSLYDTAFSKKWESTIVLEKSKHFKGYDVDKNFVYLLFFDNSASSNELLGIDLNTGTWSVKPIFSPDRLTYFSFCVLNGKAYIAGTSRNTPLVLEYDLNSSGSLKTKVVGGGFPLRSEWHQFQKDSSTQTLWYSVQQTKRRMTEVLIKGGDSEGNIEEFPIRTLKNKYQRNGKLFISEEHGLIYGTYSNSSGSGSDGFYTLLIGSETPQPTLFPFTNFIPHFSHIKDDKREKMLQKVDQLKLKNKEMSLQYKIVSGNILVANQFLVWTGEVLQPVYRYDRPINTMPGYRYVQRQPIIDGYLHTHSLIVAFSFDGRLLWRNSFSLNDIKTMTERPVLAMDYSGKSVRFSYLYNGNLVSQYISDGNLTSGPEGVTSSMRQSDRVLRNTDGGMAFWYEGALLVWGKQRIQSNDEKGEKGDFFYLQKVPFKH